MLSRVVGATLMDTVYGIQIANHDDPLILRLVEANNIFEEVSPPGRFLVDWIPMRQFAKTKRFL